MPSTGGTDTRKTKNPIKHPVNLSDNALIYGSEACGVLAGFMAWEDGILKAFLAACNGMVMGTILIALGLTLVGQMPNLFKRAWYGEPLDGQSKNSKQ